MINVRGVETQQECVGDVAEIRETRRWSRYAGANPRVNHVAGLRDKIKVDHARALARAAEQKVKLSRVTQRRKRAARIQSIAKCVEATRQIVRRRPKWVWYSADDVRIARIVISRTNAVAHVTAGGRAVPAGRAVARTG